jgi:beta-glucosidase
MKNRIEELIRKMTLDEKISMLAGADLWYSIRLPRLRIPAFKVTDGPNGSRGAQGGMGPSSVCTPVGIALGATWNTKLVEKVGEVLGDEIKQKGAHILLGPTVNIHRSPIAGRNFECYSEDPYLSGELATAIIKGIQSKGVGACIKHFVCNEQEFERNSISSEVDERPLREIYFEPFRKAISAAKPWAVMSSYNRVRGVFASENDYTLKTILKDEWAFDGIVMSDWYGTYTDNVPAGGLDLEMPGPARCMSADNVKQALASGKLTEAGLNDKIRRLLLVIEKAGLFENPELGGERGEDKPEHRKIIRQAAQEAIVLLKNENNLLPLEGVMSIAVIGENARWTQILGGGSSMVVPHYVISPLEGIRSRAAGKAKVNYAPGCFIHRTLPPPDFDTLSTSNGECGLFVEVFDNLDFSGEPAFTQTNKNVQFGWFSQSVPNVDQTRFAVRLSGFFTPKESGLHTFGLSTIGRGRLYIEGKEVIDNWTVATPYVEKTIEVQMTAGQSYPVKVEYNWVGNPMWRSLSLGHMPPQAADMAAEALELASTSEVVIFVAGLTPEWEAEGFDRVDMKLPGFQNQLIEQVAAVNPNIIVVLNSGSPIEMPWLDKVRGVVQLWYNSQEQGNALADILFGDASPSGKLPITFPKRLQDNPSYINFPGEGGKVSYGEGLFVGYRYYDKKGVEPLFPFGFGLSYTSFEYSNLRLEPEEFNISEGLRVSLDVRNTGSRSGKETIQIYVRDVHSSLIRPEKELKAFTKVSLKPGEKTMVTVQLDKEAFWFYDATQGAWITQPGEFEILVGASVQDIRLTGEAKLIANDIRLDARLHTGLKLKTILDDPQGYATFTRHFGEWIKAPDLQKVLEMTLDEIAAFAPNVVTPEKLSALVEDLSKV